MNREDHGPTLADLMILTVMAAMAISLRWYYHGGPPEASFVSGKPAPGWYIAGNLGFEACRKGCIALGVFLLYRRWRFGGPLRPAEALPLFVGLPELMSALVTWPGFGIISPDPNNPQSSVVDPKLSHYWEVGQWSLGLLAALVVATGRRWLAPWVVGALFVIAYNRLDDRLAFTYQEWANRRVLILDPRTPYRGLIARGLIQWPISVFYFVPFAGAVFDFALRDRPARAWPEQAALALGAAIFLMVPVNYFLRDRLGPPTSSLPMLAVQGSGFLAALLVVWKTEPAWRRLLGDRA